METKKKSLNFYLLRVYLAPLERREKRVTLDKW